MTENKQPFEADVALLLAQNYKEAEMESTFRSGLLGETTRVVSARSRIGLRRLTFAAVAGAAMLIIALLAWHSLTATQVKPPSPGPRDTNSAAIVQKENSNESKSAPQQANVSPKNQAKNSLEIAAIPGSSATKRPAIAKNAEPLLVVIAAQQPATDKTGHKLVIGDKILDGATLQTGKGGRLNLITRRGSEIALNSNSEISLVAGSLSARLTKGEIYCRSRQKEIEQITTPAGNIKLLGTIVNTQIKDKKTVAVTVLEGKVRLENAHGEAVVDSGKKSLLVAQLAPETGKTVNLATEIDWYDKCRLRFIVLNIKPLPGHSLKEWDALEPRNANITDYSTAMTEWAEWEKNPGKYIEQQKATHPGFDYSMVMTGAFTFKEGESDLAEFHSISPEGKHLVLMIKAVTLNRPQDTKSPRQIIISFAMGEETGSGEGILRQTNSARVATTIGLPAKTISSCDVPGNAEQSLRQEIIFIPLRGDSWERKDLTLP